MRKIAFCGAHGTGKTTLLREVERQLRASKIALTVVPEIPRVVCNIAGDAEFFRRGHNTPERQFSLLVGQPVMELAAAHDEILVLCDRTLLDHWAYGRVLFKETLLSSNLGIVLDKFVETHCASYDLIAYLPIEFPPLDDGTRESDLTFQDEIDREIRSLLTRFELSAVTLRGSVPERCRDLLGLLSSRGLVELPIPHEILEGKG